MVGDADGEVLNTPWRVVKVTLALSGQGGSNLSQESPGLPGVLPWGLQGGRQDRGQAGRALFNPFNLN